MTELSSLWDNFFGLRNVGELKQFHAQLDPSIPEQAALHFYISSWPAFITGEDDSYFAPAQHLSPDRSAVFYGKAPVVFEGTNNWAWKPFYSTEALITKLNGLINVVSGVRKSNTDANMTMILVPEKDYVISKYVLGENRFDRFDAAIGFLQSKLEPMGVKLIFQQPFLGMGKFQSLSEFEYMDSHLAGKNYITIFGFALESLGASWAAVKPNVGMKLLPEFCDLMSKFENGPPKSTLISQPNIPQSSVELVDGFETFAEPLGNTWQEFRNDQPLVDQSICLLGDSHCSIFSKRKMTYLFASTFRRTKFSWNPCGIRETPDVTGYENVVLEISSRFVV